MSEVVKDKQLVYVGGLHKDVNEMKLYQAFSVHGTVSAVTIVGDLKIRKMYAKVEMVDQEAGMFFLFFKINLQTSFNDVYDIVRCTLYFINLITFFIFV